MRRRLNPIEAALLSLVLTITVAAAERRIAFELGEDRVLIRVDDQPLATYVYRDSQILRPYFKDLYAPGGLRVTRHYPPREGTDPTDHATMHPGLWLAFGDLNGSDFWRNKAPRVEHAGFVKPPPVEGDECSFTVRNRYVTEGVVVCEEMCTYTFQVRPDGHLILWDSTFQSEQSGLSFGDQEEMGLGVRVTTPLMVRPYQNHYRPGRILNSEGRRDEKGTWGEQAAWCDYAGWVGQAFVGITIMPHPHNVVACRWHTRDYGLMVANPFGRSAFKKGSPSRTEVAPGESFHLRFGVLIHAARSEGESDATAAYQAYLKAAVPRRRG